MNNKYYISLKSHQGNYSIYWCGDKLEWAKITFEEIYNWGNDPDEDWVNLPEWIPKFTKTEIEKIMDGALYHIIEEEWECGGGFYPTREWINPIINLTPFEDMK